MKALACGYGLNELAIRAGPRLRLLKLRYSVSDGPERVDLVEFAFSSWTVTLPAATLTGARPAGERMEGKRKDDVSSWPVIAPVGQAHRWRNSATSKPAATG
jgi:hypothetical protein